MMTPVPVSPSYAIVNVQKVDSRGPRGLLCHNLRKGPPMDHVNADRSYQVLIGSSDLDTAYADAMAAVPATQPDGHKRRKDAVTHVMLLARVDPRALGGTDPRSWTAEKKTAFERAALRFFEDHPETGKVVSAVVHYDEKAPHVHGLTIPIVDVNGKETLSCKQVFGGKTKREVGKKWAALQDLFVAACKREDLDVQRGRERHRLREPSPRYQRIDIFKRRKQAEEARQEQIRAEEEAKQVLEKSKQAAQAGADRENFLHRMLDQAKAQLLELKRQAKAQLWELKGRVAYYKTYLEGERKAAGKPPPEAPPWEAPDTAGGARPTQAPAEEPEPEEPLPELNR